jgi:hypothetical protein
VESFPFYPSFLEVYAHSKKIIKITQVLITHLNLLTHNYLQKMAGKSPILTQLLPSLTIEVLERHYKNIDIFAEPTSQDLFVRKDHYRDHFRDYHKEDISCAKG